MGSFSGKGRGRGPARRRHGPEGLRGHRPDLEWLEERRLLTQSNPLWNPSNSNIADVVRGPLANAGDTLINVYQKYQAYLQQGGQQGGFAKSALNPYKGTIYFSGDSVGVSIRAGNNADFAATVTSLRGAGLVVGGTDSFNRVIEGQLPISKLPTVAALPGVLGLHPLWATITYSQGSANNQGEQSMKVDVAKTQFGVDGAGVTVGVISNSVNRFNGGLADSIATGDLPSNVNVLADSTFATADFPGFNTDEGRAMLEQIYDIAPGANLAFHTNLPPDQAGLDAPAGTQTALATAIRNLANQGRANIIVDDIGVADEPYYQDGIVAQAISQVTKNNGVIYFSSAGNSADHGFESPFRGVNATIPGALGTGRYMDFDPGSSIATTLDVTVNSPGLIVFNFDQPVGNVTSDVNVYFLDASGNIVNDYTGAGQAAGTTNNIAQGQPQEIFFTPAPGTYRLAVSVQAGSADVGRIAMYQFGSDLTFSKQYGNVGGITYSTTFGHPTSDDAIGVGAVPFWVVAPFQPFNPTPNEPFSSYGPAYKVFNADGSRKSTVQIQNKPDLSGIDGVNTSFFGADIDTTRQILFAAGSPPTTMVNQDPDTLPNFFGTSSAAPNLAAIAALMKQLSPNVTTTAVRNAMISSAIPLNGQAQGTYNVQGGYGPVQAPAALAAVDTMRIVATSPNQGETVFTAPQYLFVSFSHPINPATLQASDLEVFSPPGTIVTVGNPVFNSAVSPNGVAFPLTFNNSPGAVVNGVFSFRFKDGVIGSTDNRPLAGYNGAFRLNDVSAPRVTNTSFNGRIATVDFSEPLKPSTVRPGTVLLVRTGSSGVFDNPTNVIVSTLPGAVFNYDQAMNRVVIDLSGVSQANLPSDTYALVVDDQVTDLAGNKLDGEFSGVFPSGNGQPGGTFVQALINQQLLPPQIAAVQLDPGDPSASPPGPSSDSGIPGDQNTKVTQPRIVGRISSQFPGSLAGVVVVAQFNGLHGGTFSLNVGANGRGYTGTFDTVAVTDAAGNFLIQAPANLPDGLNTVRIVAIGQPDQPPLPGLSSRLDTSFRVDTTSPLIYHASLPWLAKIGSLKTIDLDVVDAILPNTPANPLAVPTQFKVPALNPATASNPSNYQLLDLGPDQILGTADDRDVSTFIASATYVDTTNRIQPSDPYTGRITLSFNQGLPAGRYLLVARSPQPGFQGLVDAAGNPLNQAPVGGGKDFGLLFDYQPEPVYITAVQAVSTDPVNGQRVVSGPRSFYETPAPGFTPRAEAPPDEFNVDFSNPLPETDGAGNPINYSSLIQLIRSANAPGLPPDGDFGDLGQAGGTGQGFSLVPGTSVVLVNSVEGAQFGQPGYRNRLKLRIAPGTTLPADFYRLYLPNTGNLIIKDVFGNQLDGEFLGNPTARGSGLQTASGFLTAPVAYQTFMPNGLTRQGLAVDAVTKQPFLSGLSGDGLAGGAFMTSFIVTPAQSMVQGQLTGNVIYARPDYIDNPILTTDDPDGSQLKPYPALAPEATANLLNGGDLNSAANFGSNFNTDIDRNGNSRFDRSALFAASQVQSLPGHQGPVVVVALPALNDQSKTFVLQAPAGTDPDINDGSATIPANTLLAFAPGSILKLSNASLYVQYQGSSLQTLGGGNSTNDRVTFTSYREDQIPGDIYRDTNRDGSATMPRGGDWGGIIFRNFDDTTNGGRPLDPNRPQLGRSGADDAMSMLNFARVRYAGGAVPQTIGYRFDAITLFNSRPAILNTEITLTGASPISTGGGSAQAAISGDLDSFREDDLTRGPLIRNTTVSNNSINGILVRANLNGAVQSSDAMFYPDNPSTAGGIQNYTFDAPLPYILTSRFEIGTRLVQNSGGRIDRVANRVYIQPGTMFKLQRGAAIETVFQGASLNIGDRTYINQFDANPNFGPADADFRPATVGDAKVLFTSLFDDLATTTFTDPSAPPGQQVRTIVPGIDSDNGGPVNQPTPGNVPALARWGGIRIQSGSLAVIDEAVFQYGGGSVNSAEGTIGQRDVLAFEGAGGNSAFGVTTGAPGTRASITNNDFLDNLQAPMSIEPNGLLAADPQRPLLSGNPFFRGNVMQRNDLNALEVYGIGRGNLLTVDSVWDDTDLTYALRDTIVLGPGPGGPFPRPQPDPDAFLPELKPALSLTIQSSLPDSILADGSRIARPGESVLVKLLNTTAPLGDGVTGMPVDVNADNAGGAGFLVGIDNGVDPPADPFIDSGAYSQLRILGIGANETTGQQRVPAIITSLRDNSLGKTVRGVPMFAALTGDGTPAAPGDGGVIGFGGLSLSDYNLYDPRDGNLIDNADIRYITRIEQQGGGIIDADPSLDVYDEKLGITPLSQFNTQKAMTVSNSNLDHFSQVGFIARPGYGELKGGIRVTSTVGQPTMTFFVNNTITNMPVGVRIRSEQVDGTLSPNPAQAVFLHNTFDNNAVSIFAQGAAPTATNSMSHVYMLAMNNIFSVSDPSTNATSMIELNGRTTSIGGVPSQGQYNLFSGTVPAVVSGNGATFTNNQPIFGNAGFRAPAKRTDTALGDYRLLPTSDAIDAARSELGPVNFGNALAPIADQSLDATGGIRNTTGRINPFGGARATAGPGDLVTLPGLIPSVRGYFDQWVPAIPGSPDAIPGPTSNAGGVFSYRRIGGERDQDGFLRQDYPGKANVGFGSRPFFDIGSHEYRVLNPPKITAVSALITSQTTPGGVKPVDIYAPGGIAGTNQSPKAIQFQFSTLIDPTTIIGSIANGTIKLESSGGDGIFENGVTANGLQEKFYDLSGKLAFDPVSRILTIDFATSNLILPSDLYRITIVGSGGNVIRDPQGMALDGENNVGGTPNGAQLPLPSGDGFPGGNFYVTFSIDTHPPMITPGTRVRLDSATDTGPVGDSITSNPFPAFTGSITDVFPPNNATVGQTVFLDVIYPGDPGWRLGVGTAKTGANGQFTVAPSTPLPDTPYDVGPDGLLGTPDDRQYSLARIRIVDQSGNESNPNDPNAMAAFVVDTTGPRVTATDPLPNAQANIGPGGTVQVAIAINENLDLNKLRAGGLRAVRAGGDGVFGNGNDVPLTIDPASIQVQLLHTKTGAEIIRFTVSGVTANDLYRVTIVGTGPNAVTDIAGNALDGEFSGSFPSGDGQPGGDFNLDFTVLDPSLSKTYFVSANALPGGDGSRSAPFRNFNTQVLAGPDGTLGTPDDIVIPGAVDVAGPGDTVAVLPGVYTTSVALKSMVRVVSAAPTSSGPANLASIGTVLVPGNALQTIIRAPMNPTSPTVFANDLVSAPNFRTEISGFTIASPLQGNPSTGPIDPSTIGVFLNNSDVLVFKNYIMTSTIGILIQANGAKAASPTIQSNVIVGNVVGVAVNDLGVTSLQDNNRLISVANNTIVFNTYGVFLDKSLGTTPYIVDAVNNIFWQNSDGAPARNGAAIISASNRIAIRYNVFTANGPNINSPADDVLGVPGYNPNLISPTGDPLGNITGNMGFVLAIDPRPGVGNGPSVFFAGTGANYDLTINSVAIDNAGGNISPPTDFLSRTRVFVSRNGLPSSGLPGRGPADLGAFEFRGGTPSTPGNNLLIQNRGVVNAQAALTASPVQVASASSPSPAAAPASSTANADQLKTALLDAKPTSSATANVAPTLVAAPTTATAATPRGPARVRWARQVQTKNRMLGHFRRHH